MAGITKWFKRRGRKRKDDGAGSFPVGGASSPTQEEEHPESSTSGNPDDESAPGLVSTPVSNRPYQDALLGSLDKGQEEER